MPASMELSKRATAFCKYSLTIYRRADIKTQLLALQEKYSVNINIILFCCWFAYSGQGKLTRWELLKANELLFTWHTNITTLLRQLREIFPRKTNQAGYQGLIKAILQDEIHAEKEEQRLLADHIFYPSQSDITENEKRNGAMDSLQSYLDILTVPQSGERDLYVSRLISDMKF